MLEGQMADSPTVAMGGEEVVAVGAGMHASARRRGLWSAEDIRQSMLVYAVTDRAWLRGRSLAQCVEQALDGGATFIQLREKNVAHNDIVALARELLPLCRRARVPFVIDDDVEAALEVGADGVHVGQEDAACTEARARLGEDAIIGVSVGTVAQALQAQVDGADYLGVGAMFATPTKTDAAVVSKETLEEICAAVDIPVVIIGGINASTVARFAGTGFDGAAVVSAIFAADDIEMATRDLAATVRAAQMQTETQG